MTALRKARMRWRVYASADTRTVPAGGSETVAATSMADAAATGFRLGGAAETGVAGAGSA